MNVWQSALMAVLAIAGATVGCDSDGSDGASAASSTAGAGTGASGAGGSNADGGAGTGGQGVAGEGMGGGSAGAGGGTGPEVEAPLCDVPPETPSMGACVILGGKNECNPVTQEGCDGAGAACDTNIAIDGFTCYAAENIHDICEMCGGGQGYCQPGMACPGTLARFGGPGLCSKYCCTDADCGPSGACSKELMGSFGLTTGYCVPAPI
jgi:hypothetical protein